MIFQIRYQFSPVLVLAVALAVGVMAPAVAAVDPLPSWNDGAAKQAIIEFVKTTTDKASSNYVPPAERIATFDQDGTLWVEQPLYSFVKYALDRVPELVKAKPGLAKTPPFSIVMSGDRAAMANLTTPDLEKILAATYTDRSVTAFSEQAQAWLKGAKDSRWQRTYPELVYLPMHEVLEYLRAKGYKTYIVTGGGQDFLRLYSETSYGIPPEQIIGTAGVVEYGYDETGKPMLTKKPKLLINDNGPGKPESIHLMIGRRPVAAFGNTAGDKEMLEYTKAGEGARLAVLVMHDDAKREYAYGPAQGLPDTKVGAFSQALYDQAKNQGWLVISMKNDWKQVFKFEP